MGTFVGATTGRVKLAALGFFMTCGLVFYGVMHDQQVKEEQEAQQFTLVSSLERDLKAVQCKRTSFIAHEGQIMPVWTCPDGMSHLVPKYIDLIEKKGV